MTWRHCHRALAPYANRLYAGTRNTSGAQVLTSLDGEQWETLVSDGFGNPSNEAILDLVEHSGQLYAAVESSAPTGGQVWRYDSYAWRREGLPGFGDPNNSAVAALAVYNNALYAGTVNSTLGAQVWFTEGDGWWPSSKTGFGNSSNVAATDLATFRNVLWCAALDTEGTSLWQGRLGIGLSVVSRPFVVTPPNTLRFRRIHHQHVLYARSPTWSPSDSGRRQAIASTIQKTGVHPLEYRHACTGQECLLPVPLAHAHLVLAASGDRHCAPAGREPGAHVRVCSILGNRSSHADAFAHVCAKWTLYRDPSARGERL